ncbi:DNA topoisomerase IB [uncultured Microbacterium sp.]|uniref:DNA topoisomerase IB n=1 Tax=uncultured Microbacterium sp. TaxID=191216 RepID=UPI00261402E0|nr:DNA topoisomerase IB [uncultured Microbacterium sp.]
MSAPRRLPLSRHMVDGSPVYWDGRRKITRAREIARLNALAIPPAWTDVEIARTSRSAVLARGVDAAGRTQAIYSPAHWRKQEKAKYARVLRFAQRLPRLRKQVDHDLRRRRLGEDRVIACIVALIDQEFFRVGGAEYARKHRHYGVTTLRRKHTRIAAGTVTFDFIGKNGRRHIKSVRDPRIVRVVEQLQEMPGYELFRFFDDDGNLHDIDSRRVNAYVKRHMGEEFSAKDFRTWGGTLLTASAMLAAESGDDQTNLRDIVTGVAERLGNTPAVTQESYIDPRVLAAFEDSSTIARLRHAMSRMTPKAYLSVEEQCVLRLLRQR